ncbi:MAG: hypothetical protein MUD12_01475 [Spirochaetes bacterium]|jgi:hypothetical protein|nr:hypothetical protein [Spirochaetota bacterium]
MKKAILLSILIISCTSGPDIMSTGQAPGSADPASISLKRLFSVCEADMARAGKVIISHGLVKNLSHLHRMDSGGRKYYLLEREAITRLINSVTRGLYCDYILMNSSGTVIYTMKNDRVFGKNAATQLKNSGLYKCYTESGRDAYYSDVLKVDREDGYSLFISSRLENGASSGIFVLQIGMARLRETVGEKSEAIGLDKKYKITADSASIQSEYGQFGRMNIKGLGESGVMYFLDNAGAETAYSLFRHRNLEWIIVTEKFGPSDFR